MIKICQCSSQGQGLDIEGHKIGPLDQDVASRPDQDVASRPGRDL